MKTTRFLIPQQLSAHPGPFTKILIVDDSPLDGRRAEALLRKHACQRTLSFSLAQVPNGREALQLIEEDCPDLVLTDLQMPIMDGLELVEALKQDHPSLPVILMTGQGSEEIAYQALRAGASSYVPKLNLAQDLGETVEQLLQHALTLKNQRRLFDECTFASEMSLYLPPDLALVSAFVTYTQESLQRLKLCDDNSLVRLSVALREALSNAVIHGNLEVGSDVRDTDDAEYYKLIQLRSKSEPYCSRRVHVHAKQSRDLLSWTIRDEGPGFNPESLPDPTDPRNLERASGRGLLLIRTFMDHVEHNARGNEITLLKRCRA